jgi:hypothetical protein
MVERSIDCQCQSSIAVAPVCGVCGVRCSVYWPCCKNEAFIMPRDHGGTVAHVDGRPLLNDILKIQFKARQFAYAI